MLDILLTQNGDLSIDERGDVRITDSVRQAVRIRLLWIFNEWRFALQFGVPYFEEILIKNPNIERMRRHVRDEAMSVDGVLDARNIRITIDKPARSATVTLDIVTTEETYKEELDLWAVTA